MHIKEQFSFNIFQHEWRHDIHYNRPIFLILESFQSYVFSRATISLWVFVLLQRPETGADAEQPAYGPDTVVYKTFHICPNRHFIMLWLIRAKVVGWPSRCTV